MKILIVLVTFLFVNLSQAADRVGNGGGLWTCSMNQNLEKAFLVDLYEAENEFALQLIQSNSNVDRILIERADYFQKNLSSYFQIWNGHLQNVQKNLRFVSSELVLIDDALFRIRPLPSTCKESWIYTQLANFTNLGHVLIRSDLWNSPVVPELDKAALIWHEVIYAWLRAEYGDLNSIRARQIVGILFSTLSSQQMTSEIDLVLKKGNGQNPNPKPPILKDQKWVCLIQNQMTFKHYFEFGINQFSAQTKTLQKCQKSREGFHCGEHSMTCEENQQEENMNMCQIQNQMTGQVFSAEGRSKLEAEAKARLACESKEEAVHCSTMVTCQ